jgi:hypothetical protein
MNMNTPTVSTQPLDMYRANLCLALRMLTMAQETRQQTWQLEAQIADSSAEILRDAAKSVEQAHDWATLATLPGALMRDEAQVIAKFWEGWFGIAVQSRNQMSAGCGDAMRHWQQNLQGLSNSTSERASEAAPQSPLAMPNFFAGLENFMHAMQGLANGKSASDHAAEGAAHNGAESISPAPSVPSGGSRARSRQAERHA